ncbi:MAG: trigger factor [Clostridiales bacterium]|nr:MAG: trigger factor [Clostridiales bacterium]
MKLEKVNKIATNTVELLISISGEEFEKALETAYKKNVSKMTVPGFRKGHAPRKMLEKMYGEAMFNEDALNDILPGAYYKAVEESKINPCDRPDFDFPDLDKIDRNGFSFTAKVTVMPEIAIKDYKGIKAEKISNEVTDNEVEEELARYQQRQSRLVDVEGRKTENGDTVVFDFEGFVDGVAFDGGKAENYSLKLGSGQFIPGFEEQMVGYDADSEFSVNVKFPEDYHSEDLKGKDAEFKIKLHAIKKEELPALDDEFAKDVSEFDTLDEFKADIIKKLQERKDSAVENDVYEKLTNAVVDLVEGEIPECLYTQEADNQLHDFEHRLSSQGLTLEGYLKYTGQDVESIKAMFRPNAEKQVKLRFALEKIAELENVIVEESDIDEQYKKLAEAYKIEDVEKVKNAETTEYITKDLSLQKAYEFVKANAVLTEEKKKAPAKKPAAKADDSTEKKSAAKKTAAKKTTATKKTTAKKTVEDKAE